MGGVCFGERGSLSRIFGGANVTSRLIGRRVFSVFTWKLPLVHPPRLFSHGSAEGAPPPPHPAQMCFLILGSSHGNHLQRELDLRRRQGRRFGEVSAAGIPGGRLTCDAHRKRWVRAAESRQAKTVLLVFGGNDMCLPDLDLPQLSRMLICFAEELKAVGVVNIYVFPILPRVRPRGVRRETYTKRQQAVNRNWASRFRRPPVVFLNRPVGEQMIGGDGVHLSRAGRGLVLRAVTEIQRSL